VKAISGALAGYPAYNQLGAFLLGGFMLAVLLSGFTT